MPSVAAVHSIGLQSRSAVANYAARSKGVSYSYSAPLIMCYAVSSTYDPNHMIGAVYLPNFLTDFDADRRVILPSSFSIL